MSNYNVTLTLAVLAVACGSPSVASVVDGRVGVCLMVAQLQYDLEHIHLGLEELASSDGSAIGGIEHVANEVRRARTRIDVLPKAEALRRETGLPALEGLAAVGGVGELLRELDDVARGQDFLACYRRQREAWRSAIERLRASKADACMSESPAAISSDQRFELYCTGILPLSYLWHAQLDVVRGRAENLSKIGDGPALKRASDAFSLDCSVANSTVSEIQTTSWMLDAPRHTMVQSRAVEGCWRPFYLLPPNERAAAVASTVAEQLLVDVQVRLVEHWCLTRSDSLSSAWSRVLR